MRWQTHLLSIIHNIESWDWEAGDVIDRGKGYGQEVVKLLVDYGFRYLNLNNIKDILPFMAKFPLEKLHFFGQESILAPCEENIKAQSQEVIDKWLDLVERVCEREDLLSYSEHLMYIGRKRKGITNNNV